jgi:hypothetical protein
MDFIRAIDTHSDPPKIRVRPPDFLLYGKIFNTETRRREEEKQSGNQAIA